MTTATKTDKRDRQTERRAEDRARLEAAAESLRTSQGWAAWMKVRRSANIRRLSFGNQLQIAMAKPDATFCLGYKQWQTLHGRRVNRGAAGLAITVPHVKTIKTEDENGERTEERIVSYGRGYVWDVSDTSGPELPVIDDAPAVGEVTQVHVDRLVKHIETLGYRVTFREVAGTARGWCDPVAREVVADSSLPLPETLLLLTHEAAHCAGLHYDDELGGRAGAEILAEATTFVVASALQIESSASISYVTGWSEGCGLDVLRRLGQLVDDIASEIEAAIISTPVQG